MPVYSDMMDQLSGVQWTMEVKPGLVYTGVEAAAYGVNDENIGILEKNGKQFITIAYHHTNDTDNNTRKELFNLVFVANKNADLSSLLKFSGDITPALAITKGLEERSIGFSFTTKVPDEAFINQNQPNPFRGETVIQMSLKKPSMTQITIYDAKGSAVYSGVENLSSGNQSITIGSKHLGNQTGIFYCKIKNNEVSKVIKMLRIE
ncbi:MAG: T9SS type A sorting domain-containing protein [Saprospiraceae bacterium]|nr:T9SS type A sorting domain-containing protein [Saprospiraceae bacterium]